MSSHVIACNDFLKRFAERFNTNVSAIAISIDTDRYLPAAKDWRNDRPVIGWVGSPTTARYLGGLEGVFKAMSRESKFTLKVIGAGQDIKMPGVDVVNLAWALEREISDYQGLDVGICPLENNEWDSGKTGFKIIVYMAAGVPAVVSTTGSNKEVIKDGENGFLASTDDEWQEKMSRLIKEPRLRNEMGKAARDTIVKGYSVRANAPKYIAIFKRIVQSR